jgi:cell division inhibitor SepF
MDQDEINEEDIDTESSYLSIANKKKKIVNIHTSSQVKVFILEPKTFEDAPLAVNNLKNRKPVILNLENLDKEVAKKTFDFLSGAIYAIDGNIQKINGNIFLLAPNNVDITANVKEDFKNKNLFPWQK